MTTAELLIRARDLYASAPSHAHASCDLVPGTYCPLTALRSIVPADDVYVPAAYALELAAGAFGLVAWNYKSSTKEVLAAFDRAIAAQEATT